MNLLLFTHADRIAPDVLAFNDRRSEHLRSVHRAQPGDTLRVGEVDGLMGSAEIISLDQHGARVRFVLDTSPPAKLPVTLIVALPRPKMLRRILRNAAEFGVQALHLIHSYRVEKSYWQSPVLNETSLRDYLLQGLEQACDTQLPPLQLHRRFKPWVEDVLPALCADRQAWLAHPGAGPHCPPEISGETLLVVGPEGGFIPYEVAKLEGAGCTPVSLGPRILRVENAVVSLLTRVRTPT